jgi:hypothetical protein
MHLRFGISLALCSGLRGRFEKVVEICKQYVSDRNACVLDVGHGGLTSRLTSYYKTVFTMGQNLV